MGIGTVGPGAAAPFEGHHERQPDGGQFAAETVLIAVCTIGRDRPEVNSGFHRPAGECGSDLQFRGEARVGAALGEVAGGGVGHGVKRIVQPLVRPQCGDRDDPVVGLAVSAQPPSAHVRGRGAVLPVAGVVDDQHPTGMRSGARIIQ